MPLVLLNLISTPFEIHKLSPLEIVIGCPLYLTPTSSDPQLIKGEKLQCWRGLIASIKKNRALVQQSFHGVAMDYIQTGNFSQRETKLPSQAEYYMSLRLYLPVFLINIKMGESHGNQTTLLKTGKHILVIS